MMKLRHWKRALPTAVMLALTVGGVAYAQDGGPTPESQIDVIWLLLAAFLVFFMQAGFAMVESGFSRSKNAANLLLKNLMDFAVGSLLYFAIGFGLMYGASYAGIIGTDNFFLSKLGFGPDSAYDWAGFLFQLVFAGTAATIVSGAVAERLKFSAYLVYSVIIVGIIYPISGHWLWGGGWLADLGFIDFAGSTIVHSVGGWAALAGAIVLGPRIGKFNKDGSSNVIPGHSLTLAALGVFILWFGWFGFNPGSTLSGMNPGIGYIAVTTNMAAAAGAVSALLVNWVKTGHPSTEMALNGALAGLVAITAGTASVTPIGALVIGLLAGVVLVYGLLFIERVLKVDDPVGAVAVHAINGAWGTLAVGLFAAPAAGALTGMGEVAGLFYGGGFAQLSVQAIGVLAVGLWAFVTAFIVFKTADVVMGIRVSPQEELEGLDLTEHGTISYPEFGARVVNAQPGERVMMPAAESAG
ncbi:MAG: ammonium transporter [Chloroflexi bacterium]|nr:MAG: ammonium transporter [Chloroflexota bacterium]